MGLYTEYSKAELVKGHPKGESHQHGFKESVEWFMF